MQDVVVSSLGIPDAVLARARRVADDISRAAADLGGAVSVDADEVLTGRAGLLGLAPAGRISAGGATRLLTTRDGWCALTLSRADDIESVPALLETSQLPTDHWTALADAAVGRDVKIVVANETEILALFRTSDFEEALRRAAQLDALFAITRSEKGSVIVQGSERIEQAAYPVKRVVDATGAGDAYTAGFLYGLTNGRELQDCADLGSRAATAVIQQVGARLEKDSLYRQVTE